MHGRNTVAYLDDCSFLLHLDLIFIIFYLTF